MLTPRVEKHKGVTLVVGITSGWMSIVLDATGHSFEGPVENDDDVRRIARIVVPALQQIGGSDGATSVGSEVREVRPGVLDQG